MLNMLALGRRVDPQLTEFSSPRRVAGGRWVGGRRGEGEGRKGEGGRGIRERKGRRKGGEEREKEARKTPPVPLLLHDLNKASYL